MSIHDVYNADSSRLTKLAELKPDTDGLWDPKELASIWQWQLKAPLDFDLTSFNPKSKTALDSVTRTHERSPATFGELLRHPNPPVELLRLTKDYAKAKRQEADKAVDKVRDTGPLPKEISTVLYYASIVAALVRCGKRITNLTDEELKHGIKWSIARSWVDEKTRSLLQEGLRVLKA